MLALVFRPLKTRTLQEPFPTNQRVWFLTEKTHLTTARYEDKIVNTMTRSMEARKTAGVGATTLLEPKVKVASQSVFYALRTCDGTCASGCGVSQTRVAEIIFGVEVVEWDLCSTCLSRTGFLEYFNSLPSATPGEAWEVKTLLGIPNLRDPILR